MAKTKDTVQSAKILEENAVNAPVRDVSWDVNSIQTESETNLEQDEGTGGAVIVRQFIFSANPQTFKFHPPTKQELFNHHIKQLEMFLWKDGLKIMTNVEPRLIFNKKKTQYTIIVGAEPMRGQMLLQTPQTLTQIVHNTA